MADYDGSRFEEPADRSLLRSDRAPTAWQLRPVVTKAERSQSVEMEFPWEARLQFKADFGDTYDDLSFTQRLKLFLVGQP